MIITPTPRDLCRVLVRRKTLVCGTALACLAAASCYEIVAPPRFTASTSFVARFSTLPSEVPGSSQTAIPDPTPVDHEEIMNSYMLELQSTELLRRVVSGIGPDRIYPHRVALDPLALLAFSGPALPARLRQQAAVDAAVKRLQSSDLTVTGARDANVFTLAVRNPDRAVALALTSRLGDAFLQLVSTLDHNPRLEFVRAQLGIYRAAVTRSEMAMDAFKKTNHISSMVEERTVYIQERALLEQAMMNAESKEAENEARYDALRTELGRVSPIVTTAQNDRDPLELSARTNLSALQAKDAELRVAFSGNSDAAMQVARSLSAARQILADAQKIRPLTHSDPNHAFQELQIATVEAEGDAKATREAVAVEKTQLASLDGRLAAMDSVESTFQDLSRNYENADQNYRIYLQGAQQARLDADLDNAAVTSVAVFDPTYAPIRPSAFGILFLALVTLAGLIGGALLALITESLDEGGGPDPVRHDGDVPTSGAAAYP